MSTHIVKAKQRRHSAGYRLGVLSRVVAAAVGGYAVASLFIVGAGYLTPWNKARAVLGGSLLAFAVWAAVVMWVFSARSAARAWLGVAVVSALLGAVLWYFKQKGGA